MAPAAAYDGIADWYEFEFAGGPRAIESDPLGVGRALRELLGPGCGPCLEVGCGTGAWASVIRELGRAPFGVDVSAAMLRYATGRLPAVRADAERLPFPDGRFPAVITVMAHTDLPGYPTVLREAARVLRPGGVVVHVGVHPCFCGGFADRTDPSAVVIAPGYLDGNWTKHSWTEHGVRDKVGATHWPLPRLLHAFLDAGLVPERFAECGEPVPAVLAVRARKTSPG